MNYNIEELKNKVLNNKYETEYLLNYIGERLRCNICNSDEIDKIQEVYYCYNCKKVFLTEKDILENLDKYDDDTDYIRAHQDNINSFRNRRRRY